MCLSLSLTKSSEQDELHPECKRPLLLIDRPGTREDKPSSHKSFPTKNNHFSDFSGRLHLAEASAVPECDDDGGGLGTGGDQGDDEEEDEEGDEGVTSAVALP